MSSRKTVGRRSKPLRKGLALATIVGAALVLAVSANASPSHVPACYSRFYQSLWDVRSAHLKLVRSGTWTQSDQSSTATATETDLMSPLRHRLHNRHALTLNEICKKGRLVLTTQYDNSGLERGGTEALNGQSTGSSGQEPCHAQAVFTTGFRSEPFAISPATLPQAGFKLGARRAEVDASIQLPPGLSCQTPSYPGATFDYPPVPFDTISSSPVTVSARMLEKDRGFTLTFSGAKTVKKQWMGGFGPLGTEQFQLRWSGAITFTPTGCRYTNVTSGTTSRRCYPG